VTADFTNNAAVTGTPPTGSNTTDNDDSSVDVINPSVSLTKTGTLNDDDGTAGLSVGDTISYAFTVENTGNVTLTNITLADTVGGVTISGGPIASLAPGASDNTTFTGSYTITQADIDAGSFTNTATVTGTPPSGPDVTDDDDETVNLGSIFDPPSAIKTINEAGLPELEFRMVWINSGNIFAIDVQVTDDIPTGTTYVPGSVTCEPRGSSSTVNVLLNPVPVSPLIAAVPTWSCGYDAVNNRVQWQGTIGPDNGNLTEATAANEVVITFRVTVDDGVNQVQNQGISRTDVDDDGDFDEENVWGTSLVGSNRVVWRRGPSDSDPDDDLPRVLPSTGFAPERVTLLPKQTEDEAYANLGNLWLEIPSLGVKTSIVGVPKGEGEWNVDWLWEQAGWLQGTAFPTWQGNSVLTAHVYLPNGEPGPFVDLSKLRFGDQVILHAFGSRHVYELRTNHILLPTSMSPFKHEQHAWLTLLTCRGYDESSDTYKYRIEARAVLMEVIPE
jgi:LPXTG-site transpeptidase (sortase) family protein